MTRYTIDVDEEFERTLSRLSAEKGRSKAEVIRRAVATYSYLENQTGTDKGTKVSITSDSDQVLKDVVLP